MTHVTTEAYDEEGKRAVATCSCGQWSREFAVGGTYQIGRIDTPDTAKRCAHVAALYHRLLARDQ